MNEYINWIVIPVTAGVVGYITNAIAIKMLFRPYLPHWYTLGWQGIIPRTRSVLAVNVGKVVGERLLTEAEIRKALSSIDLRNALYNAIYKVNTGYDSPEARQVVSEKLKYHMDMMLRAVADSLEGNEELRSSVDTYAAKAVRKAVLAVLSIRCTSLASWVQKAAASDKAAIMLPKLRLYAEKEIKEQLNSFVHSGKSLADLTGDALNVAELSVKVSDIVLPMFQEFLLKPSVLDRLSRLLIAYKEEEAPDNVLMRGAINMFLSDEKIEALVHNKVPVLAEKIISDAEVRRNLASIIEEKLNELLHTPFSKYAEQMGDKYYKLLHNTSEMLAAKAISTSLTDKIVSILAANADKTIGEALAGAGVSVADIVPDSVPFSKVLMSGKLSGYIKDAVSGNISSISLSHSQVEALSSAITDWIIYVLTAFVPQALRYLNITGVVEEKINSLDVREVEEMLFSFMRSHFKWINILGFVIGFIVGLGQMLFIKIFS